MLASSRADLRFIFTYLLTYLLTYLFAEYEQPGEGRNIGVGAQSSLGGKTFLRTKNVSEKLTKCRNFTRFLPEKLPKYPNFHDICPKK